MTYETTDLGLATALSLNYTLIDVTGETSRKTFVFEEDESLKEAVVKYFDGHLPVDAQRYFSQLRNLKARIYDHR